MYLERKTALQTVKEYFRSFKATAWALLCLCNDWYTNSVRTVNISAAELEKQKTNCLFERKLCEARRLNNSELTKATNTCFQRGKDY